MKIWRWIALAAGAVAAAGFFVGWVYAASEAHYRSFPAPAPFTQRIPDDMTSCNECHGFDLRSHAPWPGAAPDLIVVGATRRNSSRG
jgi:hypothetical protein